MSGAGPQVRDRTLWRTVLLGAGSIVAGIGAAGLFSPAAFHRANGVDLGGDISLLSEVRAAGGALLAAGVLIMLGAVVARWMSTAAALGAVVYLSYGLSRVLGIAVDGVPADGLVIATGAEIVLGLACLLALVRFSRSPADPARAGVPVTGTARRSGVAGTAPGSGVAGLSVAEPAAGPVPDVVGQLRGEQ
ncbi:DUF4345 domain-containing protein [Micromonospora echinofusca]|uniref:DUF4345 domain-containing protein n=1 Tax=Micromonospora echinofusca TaxID=47858 RepID=A0ABS3VS32_MICEH|nr:DUF4345 domain-containing protein [Micromonospora echinofusca]MBO4207320.1 DUF4345 domain-containing protein [Micromonospora echinofusca]